VPGSTAAAEDLPRARAGQTRRTRQDAGVRRLLPDGPAVVEDLWPLYDLPAAPHLRAGFVLSVAVAVDGSSRPLSGPADRAVFRVLRAVSDVVLVGAGTARDEDYGPVRLRKDLVRRRREQGRPDQPALAVVTRSLRLGASARLFSDPSSPLLLLAPASAEPPAGLPPHVEVVSCGDGDVEPARVLAALHARGHLRVLCEGGPRLLRDLLAAGLVDELCLTTSPQLAGGGPALLPDAVRADLRLEHLLEEDGELLARWSVSSRRG
jgi:riboflavin biosynthesis pyrimidine reductase